MDLYISVDIEADGPIPGINSMLSLGAAAFYPNNRTPISTFEINLVPLVGASPDPETMAWWARQDPKVWSHVTSNPVFPQKAMSAFTTWVNSISGSKVMVTYPTWDYMWVHYYLVRFLGPKGTPFGLGALDIKSMAFGLMPEFDSFKGVTKRNMPAELFEGCPPHTHQALDDAIGQGVWFINLLAQRDSISLSS